MTGIRVTSHDGRGPLGCEAVLGQGVWLAAASFVCGSYVVSEAER